MFIAKGNIRRLFGIQFSCYYFDWFRSSFFFLFSFTLFVSSFGFICYGSARYHTVSLSSPRICCSLSRIPNSEHIHFEANRDKKKKTKTTTQWSSAYLFSIWRFIVLFRFFFCFSLISFIVRATQYSHRSIFIHFLVVYFIIAIVFDFNFNHIRLRFDFSFAVCLIPTSSEFIRSFWNQNSPIQMEWKIAGLKIEEIYKTIACSPFSETQKTTITHAIRPIVVVVIRRSRESRFQNEKSKSKKK